MWRPPPTDDPALAAIATQEAVIMELTRILSEREAEINLVAQQNLSMERFFQEQQRQMIKANSAITYRDLDGTATQISETAKKVASLEEEGKSQREAMLVAEETIKKKDELIEQLKQEKVVITKKLTETETQVAKTAKKVASLEEKSKSQREAMSVAEDTIKEKDELIVQLKQQGKNSRFMDENERLIEEAKKATHAMESSDILINAQRHRIEELETLLNTYEKRFLTKDVDVPKSTSFVVDYLIYFFLQR
jgi:chromosome segregation ATPase